MSKLIGLKLYTDEYLTVKDKELLCIDFYYQLNSCRG
jgi:hypothetical protein